MLVVGSHLGPYVLHVKSGSGSSGLRSVVCRALGSPASPHTKKYAELARAVHVATADCPGSAHGADPRQGFLLPQKKCCRRRRRRCRPGPQQGREGREATPLRQATSQRHGMLPCNAPRFKTGLAARCRKILGRGALMALRPPAAFSLFPRPWIGLLLIRLAHLRGFIRRYVHRTVLLNKPFQLGHGLLHRRICS